MAEYLYVELRTRERPYYVRVDDDGRLAYVDAHTRPLEKWTTVEAMRQEARQISRAIPCETMSGVVLVPV